MNGDYIYYLYDQAGSLLYIGKSHDPFARLRAHHKQNEWSHNVCQVDAYGPYQYRIAAQLERKAIEHHDPPHNVMFTSRWKHHPAHSP